MQYKILFSGLLFFLILPLQILGDHSEIFLYDDTKTYSSFCAENKVYNFDIFFNVQQFKTNKSYCRKCVKIVHNNKYVVGRIIDFNGMATNNTLEVSQSFFEHLEDKNNSNFQAEWFFVSCDLLDMVGECSNLSCSENDQLKTTNTTRVIPSTKNENSFIIIIGCITVILIGILSIFMLIKKRRFKKNHELDFSTNEEFRNGSIQVVLNNSRKNDNIEINNNNKDDNVETKSKNKHSIVGINSKVSKVETKINNGHSRVGINGKVISENINVNNNNKFAKNGKDTTTGNIDVEIEINYNNKINNYQDNQNNIIQNNLIGKNVFPYSFQNSGDFAMSSMPLFNNNNNNNNNNNQNNNYMQIVPPSYEDDSLPEYSDINKLIPKENLLN